ncbi:MAG: sialidase family protein [Chloroflexota bacterium]
MAGRIVDIIDDNKGMGYPDSRKIAEDSQGNLYIAYRKKHKQGGKSRYHIFVSKSTDGGQSWSVPNDQPIDETGAFTQRVPSIAIDSRDVLHVVWYGTDVVNSGNNQRQIKYARSTNGGQQWSTWQNIAPVLGYKDESLWQEHPVIAVGADDALYIVWEGRDSDNRKSTQTKFTCSTNGGRSWKAWTNVNRQSVNRSRPTVVATSNGTVHVFAYGYAETGQQIVWIQSNDQGQTWSEWQRVAPSNKDQRHVSVAVDSQDRIHVAWRQQLDSGSPVSQAVYALYDGLGSNQGWYPAEVVGSNIVEYQFFVNISIAANDTPCVAWTETPNSSKYPSDAPVDGTICFVYKVNGQWSERELIRASQQDIYPCLHRTESARGTMNRTTLHITWLEDVSDDNKNILYDQLSLNQIVIEQPAPPETEPPVTEPPVTEPPVTEPEVISAGTETTNQPTVTESTVTESTVTESTVTEPPTEPEPLPTEPPLTGDDATITDIEPLLVDTIDDEKGMGYPDSRKIVQDSRGTLYVAYRKKNKQGGKSRYHIFVAKSSDGGATWEMNGDKPIEETGAFTQRVPSMTIDSQDVLHVTWYGLDAFNQGENQRQIKYARSSDGGVTWSTWQNIAHVDGYTDDPLWQEHPTISCGSDDAIYIVWEGRDAQYRGNMQTKFVKSTNGGQSWSEWVNIQPTMNNNRSRPALLATSDNTLHVFAYGYYERAQQIVWSRSFDGGQSWSEWFAIAPSERDQRHLSVALDGRNRIHVAWRQLPNAQDYSDMTQVHYTRYDSLDTTKSWEVPQMIAPNPERYQFFPSISVGYNDTPCIVWSETAFDAGYPSESPLSGTVFYSNAPAPHRIWTQRVPVRSALTDIYPSLHRDNTLDHDVLYVAWLDNQGGDTQHICCYKLVLDVDDSILLEEIDALTSEPVVTEPVEPEPVEPEPVVTEPVVTESEPTEPEPTEPVVPTPPEPTEPEPVVPEPTEPEPVVTEPEPVVPEPTEPIVTEPEPIITEEEPEPVVLNPFFKDEDEPTGPITLQPLVSGGGTPSTGPTIEPETEADGTTVTAASFVSDRGPALDIDRRVTDAVATFNLRVHTLTERGDYGFRYQAWQQNNDPIYVVKHIFTTRDGFWMSTGTDGAIERWARELYLKRQDAPDFFAEAGSTHHLFGAVLGTDGKLIPNQEFRYWDDGFDKLADPSYRNYLARRTNNQSGWSNFELNAASAYAYHQGATGRWCWAPAGAAEVVEGGGLPSNLQISTFVVWQEVARKTLGQAEEEVEAQTETQTETTYTTFLPFVSN